MPRYLLKAEWGQRLTGHKLGGRPDLITISLLVTALKSKFPGFPGSRSSALPTNYSKHLTESQNHSPVGNFGESLIQIPSFYTEASLSQTLCWALGQKDYTI